MTIDVYDFFSGCGGTSKGFQNAGLNPLFALDFDEYAANTLKKNFLDVHFSTSDITQFDTTELDEIVFDNIANKKLFCGCAPCQPFTKQNTTKPNTNKDTRR